MKRKVNKLEKNKYLKKYTCLKGSLKGSNTCLRTVGDGLVQTVVTLAQIAIVSK